MKEWHSSGELAAIHAFEAVAGRLKAALGLKEDAALAKALGLEPNAYANRKRAGSIPAKQIIDLASSEKVSLDQVFGIDGLADLTQEHAWLLRAWDALNDRQRQALRRLLDDNLPEELRSPS